VSRLHAARSGLDHSTQDLRERPSRHLRTKETTHGAAPGGSGRDSSRSPSKCSRASISIAFSGVVNPPANERFLALYPSLG